MSLATKPRENLLEDPMHIIIGKENLKEIKNTRKNHVIKVLVIYRFN